MNEPQEGRKDIVIFCASEEFSRIAAEVIQNRGLENHISIVNATGEETIKKGRSYMKRY